MNKGWYICLIILGVIWLLFSVVMVVSIKEMIIDYKCNQLSKEEFYKEVKCKSYWD